MAVVGGPHSLEYYKLFHGESKFERIATKVWQQGDDAIYSIPRRSRSLAHILSHQPADVRAYVADLEDPSLPEASFIWRNRHAAIIHGTFNRDQLLSVQVSYHPGWRATVDGQPRPLTRDQLGLILVEPRCSGPCTIELKYHLSAEAVALRLASLATLLLLALFTLRAIYNTRS